MELKKLEGEYEKKLAELEKIRKDYHEAYKRTLHAPSYADFRISLCGEHLPKDFPYRYVDNGYQNVGCPKCIAIQKPAFEFSEKVYQYIKTGVRTY